MPRSDVYVDIFPFTEQLIRVDSIVWIVGINVYIAILFECIYRLSGVIQYRLIAGFYIFSILEFFLLYNKAWFYVFGVPVYSDTFIVLTFVYIFSDRWSISTS